MDGVSGTKLIVLWQKKFRITTIPRKLVGGRDFEYPWAVRARTLSVNYIDGSQEAMRVIGRMDVVVFDNRKQGIVVENGLSEHPTVEFPYEGLKGRTISPKGSNNAQNEPLLDFLLSSAVPPLDHPFRGIKQLGTQALSHTDFSMLDGGLTASSELELAQQKKDLVEKRLRTRGVIPHQMIRVDDQRIFDLLIKRTLMQLGQFEIRRVILGTFDVNGASERAALSEWRNDYRNHADKLRESSFVCPDTNHDFVLLSLEVPRDEV